MSTLAEQVAALQPGDGDIEVTVVAKALHGSNGTKWLTLDNGMTIRYGNGDLLPGLTAVRVITPAQPVRPDPEIGTFWWLNGYMHVAVQRGPYGGPFKTYLKSANGLDEVAWADASDAVQALPPDTPAEPPCPFEIGATVYHVNGKGVPFVVKSWNGETVGVSDSSATTLDDLPIPSPLTTSEVPLAVTESLAGDAVQIRHDAAVVKNDEGEFVGHRDHEAAAQAARRAGWDAALDAGLATDYEALIKAARDEGWNAALTEAQNELIITAATVLDEYHEADDPWGLLAHASQRIVALFEPTGFTDQ